jgi:A/G-specific adenine glycosylase
MDNDGTPVDSPVGRKRTWKRASELLDPERPRLFNSALMELGQTMCRSGKPDCLLCPIRDYCRAENPEYLPVKLPKIPVERIEHHDILSIRNKSILLARSPEGGRHAGMYRFPQREDDHILALPVLFRQTYSVTRYRVTRYIHRVTETPRLIEGEEWIPLSRLHNIPMASPDRKALSSPKIAELLYVTESKV